MNHLYNVMTDTTKKSLVNFRVNTDIKNEFEAVAKLRGSTLSGLIHQYIVAEIRKEKERDRKAFDEQLALVVQNFPDEEKTFPVNGKKLKIPIMSESAGTNDGKTKK